MVKVKIYEDELYPFYFFSDFIGYNPDGVIEISEEEFKTWKTFEEKFEEFQDHLESLYVKAKTPKE